MSCGWTKASASRLHVNIYHAVLGQIVSLRYLSRSTLHRLPCLHFRLLLSYGFLMVTREAHRSSLMRLMFPDQDNFIFGDYVCHFCLLTDSDIGPSVPASNVEHTYFHFVCAAASLIHDVCYKNNCRHAVPH